MDSPNTPVGSTASSPSAIDMDSGFESPRSCDSSSSHSISSTLSPPPTQEIMKMPGFKSICSVDCSQCKNTYTDPRVLPCLHTFCYTCIETLLRADNTLACPTCHVEVRLSLPGVGGLLPDYGFINFMNSIKEKLNCTSCKNQTSYAVAKCISCDNFLCRDCVMAHAYMHCFDGHKVIHFPQELQRESPEILKRDVAVCLSHKNPVIYFCCTCDEPLCETCTKHDHIQGLHRYEPIAEVLDSELNHLNRLMEESKLKAEEMTVSLKYTGHTTWWLHAQYKESLKRIHETYEHYSALLLKHKQDQINALDSSYSNILLSMNDTSKKSQESLEKYSALKDFYLRLFKFGSPVQCLMFKKLLEAKLASFLSFKIKQISFNIRFVSNFNAIRNGIMNTFGYLTSAFDTSAPVLNALSPQEESFDVLKLSQALSSTDLLSSTPKVNPIGYSTIPNGLPFKYEKWSSCLDDLKNDFYSINDLESNGAMKQFSNFIATPTIARQVITYEWKFGSHGNGQGQFTEPNGVAVNNIGDVIVADTNNNRVQVFDKFGRFKFQFGSLSGGDKCSLLFPNRVAVVQETGDVVVTERSPTHQVQIYNQYGQFVRKFGADILQHPRAVTVDKDGRIIVVECKVMRVIIFDQFGNVLQRFMCHNSLHFPNGVAVNDKKEIFISDNRTHCVVVYDYEGTFLRQIGREGVTNYPIGVMLSSNGHIIVADNHNNFNLTVFTQDGQLVAAYESKVKHAQCYDVALSKEGKVVLTCKDFRVYMYNVLG